MRHFRCMAWATCATASILGLAAPLCAQGRASDAPAYDSPVTDPPMAEGNKGVSEKTSGPDYVKRFSTFPGARSEILSIIGAARERLWLMTNYLTDGDIVTALFLAKYRKVDVRVVLDRRNVNNYMSRLDYLKRQNIPAFLKPERFPSKAATVLVADNTAYQLNASLDFMSGANNFTLLGASAAEIKQWADALEAATTNGTPAIPRPMMQAGKEYTGRSYYRPAGSDRSRTSPEASDSGYNYNRNRSRQGAIPEGIPRHLPKSTIYQERQRKAAEKAAQEAMEKASKSSSATSPEPTLAPDAQDTRMPSQPNMNSLSPRPEEP